MSGLIWLLGSSILASLSQAGLKVLLPVSARPHMVSCASCVQDDPNWSTSVFSI